MKSVLISIQPNWCELIASGKKTVEVRKTKPKLLTPFKCYIYCTKKGVPNRWLDETKHGKVIGEFVCDYIEDFKEFEYGIDALHRHIKLNACIGYREIYDYLGFAKCGYGWHISDLVIYDKSKELSEFKKINRECWYADLGLAKRDCPECKNKGCFVTRPPQSWCYVEVLENG